MLITSIAQSGGSTNREDAMINDNKYVKLHEKWILEYVIENKALAKKIEQNNKEIQKLRNWNREILGRGCING